MKPPTEKGPNLPARVVAMSTADGALGFNDERLKNQVYMVYPSTITKISFIHPNTGKTHEYSFIWADAIDNYPAGWVPIDLLDWFGKELQIKRALNNIH